MRMIAAILGGVMMWGVVVSCGDSTDKTDVAAAHRPPGVLIINYAPDSADTFPAPKVESLLVLEWLQMETNAHGIYVTTVHFQYGELLTQIGNQFNGQKGNWIYEINGQTATKAVSEQRISRHDTLTFTYK